MRKVLLFNHTDKLYDCMAALYQGQNSKRRIEFNIIVPSPHYADIFREKLLKKKVTAPVITISNFLDSLLKEFKLKHIRENYQTKAQLKLTLSCGFSRIIKDKNYNFFDQAFNLLTDFRSFSPNRDVIFSILDRCPPDIRESVIYLESLMEELGLIDEHLAYVKLSEALEHLQSSLENDDTTQKIYFFCGFDFFSPVQIDFLKSLSQVTDVYIPYFESVYNEKSHLDWIEWFEADEVLSVSSSNTKKNIELYTFPKNSISKAIKKVLTKKSIKQVVFAQKNLDYKSTLESSIGSASYKVSLEFLSENLEEIHRSLLSVKKLSQESFEEKILGLKEEAVKNKNFRVLKILQLYFDVFSLWRDFNDDSAVIDVFELKCFRDIVSLNLPRMNIISLEKDDSVKVCGIDSIQSLSDQEESLLCVSSGQSVSGEAQSYLEGVEKHLATLGPLKTTRLEKSIAFAKVQNFLNFYSPVVLMEEVILSENILWKELFKPYQAQEKELELRDKNKASYLEFQPAKYELKKLSASLMQTFIDCPLKFRLRYVDRFESKIEYIDGLSFLELGRVEHEVIESYVSHKENYSFSELKDVIESKLENYIRVKKVSALDKASICLEVLSLTKDVIKKLCSLKSDGADIFFEKSITSDNSRGSIDCIIIKDDKAVIIDFKRSLSSVPSRKEFELFHKLQLWFYAKRFKTYPLVAMGYLNLKDMSKSLFYHFDQVGKEITHFFEIRSLEMDLLSSIALYQRFEDSLAIEIKNERVFPPRPKSKNVCSYCSYKSSCPRGE